MMTFTLLPGEECDVPDMVRVFRAAFDPDPIVGRLKCDVPDDCRNEALAQAFSKTFAEKGVYGARFFKVVEEETGYEMIMLAYFLSCSFLLLSLNCYYFPYCSFHAPPSI